MRISQLLYPVSYETHAVRGSGNEELDISPITALASSLLRIDNVELVGPGYILKGGERIYEMDGEALFTGYVRRWTEDGRAYLNRGKEKPDSLFARVDQLEKVCIETFYTFAHYNLIYGHFLLEMLPKLLLIRDLIARGYVYPVALPGTAPDWMRKHLSEILPNAQIVHFDDTKQKLVGNVLAITGDFLFMHPWIVNEYASFVQPQQRDRKVFLVRPEGHYSRRVFVSEPSFVEIARERGFEIVEPSSLGIREQAAIFASCSIVVGEFTSALHNALFSPRGTVVIGINRVSDIQWKIANACGHCLYYVAPEGGSIDWSERVNFHADTDLFRKALDLAESRA